MPHICAEIQYDSEIGTVHSNLCGDDTNDKEWGKLLHEALDEWLNKSNGTGHFVVGPAMEDT